ncbi:MAG: hypothetical protein WAU15_12305 [Nitrosomonas sp.]
MSRNLAALSNSNLGDNAPGGAFPGELVYFKTKRLSFLNGQFVNEPPEYLFAAIDDFFRELYADIFPIKPSTALLASS